MAYIDQQSRSRNVPSIAGVVAVHGMIGYALFSGLAYDVIRYVPPVFTVESIRETLPPPPVAQPPEHRQVVKAAQPTMVRVPVDPLPALGDAIVSVDAPRVDLTPTPANPPTLPDLGSSKASGPGVRGVRAEWITSDDYPPSSIRAEEEGTVGISARIDSKGRVDACTVTASSGHPALDAATCRIYQRRARFVPALDAARAPIESSYADRIRWQLPQR